MPLYYYVCPKCGHKEIQFKKMKDRNEHYCSKCKTLMIRSFNHIPHVIYNSSGFYSTTFDRLEEDEPNVKKR